MPSVRVCSFFISIAAILAISQVPALHLTNLFRRPVDRSEADPGISCLSWRLGVETHNIRDWATVPQICEGYVALYMLGPQYREDSRAVTDAAFRYAKGLKLAGDGKDIWIFDIDDTSLSNLPLHAQYGFGADAVNYTVAEEWQLSSEAAALPESLELYRRLTSLGIKVVFISGRPESMRNSTERNQKKVGYHTWEKVILRDLTQMDYTQVEYKSVERTKLVESGYRIIGNIGDQWSDFLGAYPGKRTFKLPNPMYYAQ